MNLTNQLDRNVYTEHRALNNLFIIHDFEINFRFRDEIESFSCEW